MATAIASEHTEPMTADLVAEVANLKRQLRGERVRKWAHIQTIAELTLRLERTARRSKGRLRAIRGYRHALTLERLRHGYIVPESMTSEQCVAMLQDIAAYKVKCEQGLCERG